MSAEPDPAKAAFAPEIRRLAADLGLTPDSATVTALEATARERAFVNEAGTVQVQTRTGAIDASDFLASELRKLAPANPVPTRPGATMHLERGRSGLLPDLARQWAQATADAALNDALQAPNPWRSGHENRTRQQIILNSIPALAAEMKAKAGLI